MKEGKNKKTLKVALVHDYLKEIGGAEMVLMQLKEMFPEAPVYTAYKFPSYWGQYKDVLDKWDIRESWGRWLPFLPKFLSYYTVLSPLFFKSIDLSSFDVVIVSQTGGYFPNGVRLGKNTKLITYCHTPPRFLYGYPSASSERFKWYWRVESEIANHILRMVDFSWAQRSTVFVANSKNVARRINKFYRREAEVIYPPIEIPKVKINLKRKDYFLSVSRIVGTKNIELAVAAANKYGFKLKIAGRPIGRTGKEILKKITGPNVEYLGEVSQEAKLRFFAEAKGFLALESDADFGMSTVEPQAFGTPVVALRAGGYLEAVEEDKTGVFFDELTEESLWKGIQKFNSMKWDRDYIQKFAGEFSKEKFVSKMLKLIQKYA